VHCDLRAVNAVLNAVTWSMKISTILQCLITTHLGNISWIKRIRIMRRSEEIMKMKLLSLVILVNGIISTNCDDQSEQTFPNIKSQAQSDLEKQTFSIPQPSLDLDPTSLSESAPMIMSLPELQSNLEETDFARNFKMDFQITQPKLDLKPSFETDFESVGSDSYNKDSVSKSTEENQKAEEKPDRRKRESSQILTSEVLWQILSVVLVD